MKLCSDVAPMPFDQVVDVIQDAFAVRGRRSSSQLKKSLLVQPIAQVHRAVLKSGEQVVIKVQRRSVFTGPCQRYRIDA